MANTQTALTYGVDITDRTELVNAISSHLIFFKGESGIYELAPTVTPFLNVLGQMSVKKAYGTEEEYAESRGSFLQTPLGYISASGTTAITALAPNAATYTGLKVVTAIDGSTRNNNLKVNDAFVLVDYANPTLTAVGWVTAVSDDSGDAQYSWKLLTNTPGFNIDVTSGQRTAIWIPSRQAANGAAFATASYEKNESRWNSVTTFEDGYEIDDETMLNTQHFANIDLAASQIAKAQRRLMKKVDTGLLFASQRVGTTAGNPFSAPGTLVSDASGYYAHPTMSIAQAAESTANGDYSLGGTRIFKMTTSTATVDDLESMCSEIFQYNSPQGGRERRVFCGTGARLALSQIARRTGTYQLLPDQKEFGLDWETFKTPFGKLKITLHDGLVESPYNNAMFIIDPTQIELRELEPMKSEATPRTQRKHKWDLTHKVGLRVKFPEASTAIAWFN